jgi:hypothetical protein
VVTRIEEGETTTKEGSTHRTGTGTTTTITTITANDTNNKGIIGIIKIRGTSSNR